MSMTRETLGQIHEAVVKDNLAEFKKFVKSNSDLSFSYGRFPILSLCYLYGSYKILEKYEKFMLGLSNYTDADEFSEDYLKFKEVAGKSVRLYSDQKVLPIEMLAILGDSETIAKNYKKLYKTGEITEKLQKIYSLTHEETIEISVSKFAARKNKISVPRKIFLSLVLVVMCFMLAFPAMCLGIIGASTGLGTKASPIVIRNESELIKSLEKGNRSYKLLNDIVLTKKLNAEKFSGNLDGDSHSLTLSDKQDCSLFETLSGTVSNLKISAKLDEFDISENFGVIATNSSGNIEGCEVSVDGTVNFIAEEDTYFSLFVVTNDGKITNSKASGNITAKNDTNTNAFLVGFAGTNNGEIENCKTENGEFLTDTVDLAGFVIDNYGKISGCENNFNLSQSTEKEWHPNTSGIVINNYGEIAGVVNRGEISSVSTNKSISNAGNEDGFFVYSAGVACVSLNAISNAKNYGKISASSLYSSIFVGGIAGLSTVDQEAETEGTIKNCKSFGEIVAEITDASFQDENVKVVVYAGGICGEIQCEMSLCGFEGKIQISSDGVKYVGGLGGLAAALYSNRDGRLVTPINSCYASTEFVVSEEEYKGGLFGMFIVGDPTSLSTIFTNCHYVRNGTTAYSGYVFISALQARIVMQDSDQIKSYESLETLKASAGGLNFDE